MPDEVGMTPAEGAQKWGDRLKGAGAEIRRGVERVRESPTEKAAAQQDKMLARLTEAIRTGKWARGLARVTLAEWKSSMTDLGIGRIPAGVDRAQGKMTDFLDQLFAHENAGLAEVNRMSDVTLEDSIARATAWMRHMAGFVRR